MEKRLAFAEVAQVTAALRNTPVNTIVVRGMSPNHIILLSQVTRADLNSDGDWPITAAETPYEYGDLDFYWLNRNTPSGATAGYPFYALSVSYYETTIQGNGFLGQGSNFPEYYDIGFNYAVSNSGIGAPGGSGGTFNGAAADGTYDAREMPRFTLAQLTKVFLIRGFKIESNNAAGTGAGSGNAQVLNQAGFMGSLQALAPYYTQTVIFGEYGCQFWDMDVDWAQSQFLRAIDNMPLMSPRSVTPYGGGDVVFLSSDGIRSLAARDSSNLAQVSDIGSAIDLLMRDATADEKKLAIGAVHNETGQLWMFVGAYVYVLSRHSSAGVMAWSRYALPATDDGGEQDFSEHPNDTSQSLSTEAIGPFAADVTPAGLSLAFRTFEDRFFVYGGSDQETYDAASASFQTPYMDFGKPKTTKVFSSIDVACSGAWLVEASIDPFAETWETIGTITNSSYGGARIPYENQSEHLSLRLTSTSASRAVVGQIAVRYELGSED